MKDLSKRIFSSLILIPAAALCLIFAKAFIFQYIVVCLAALLTCVAVWEYEQFVKEIGGKLFLPVILFFTFLEVVSFYVGAQFAGMTMMSLAIFFFAFFSLFALHLREKRGAIIDVAVSSFGLTYIAVPMGMMMAILYFSAGQDGRWWVAYLITITKIADIGAYFAGNLWGKRQLAPQVSPGKTIEGTCFGLVCAIGASVAFHFLSLRLGAAVFYLGWMESLLFGFILGLIGPLGDLSESLLKRDANVKDSNALPGIGGVLDMVDSLLFTSPIIYLYLYFVR